MRAEQYSQSAVMDVRDACALALRRVVEGIDRHIGGEHVKFVRVFDEWPDFMDVQQTPTACIVPPQGWEYDDAAFTPKLMEQTIETWTVDVAGEPPAFGLYKTAEMKDEFLLAMRLSSPAMRSVYKLAVEEAFQTANVTMDPDGQKYGLLVDLPEYWGMGARFSLIRGENIDDEDAAGRNRRDAQFVISAQAPKVQLGAVYTMGLSITKVLQTQVGGTILSETKTFPPQTRS
jgi:hypothetical protein